MVAEHEQTINALRFAIQMEIDGKEYYLRTSQKSRDELGRKLLQSLAVEEDMHRQKFEEIYDAIRVKKAWPVTDFQPDGGKRLRTIFAETSEEVGNKVNACATELEAIETAIDKENKTYDFYKSQGKKAVYGTERDFYETLAAEEQEHHLILLDYYEYLGNPAAWFVKKEHPSLDSG